MTPARAKCSLAVLVVDYLAIAMIARAPNYPLTVLLPAGTHPPSWASHLAGAMDRLHHRPPAAQAA